MPPSPAEVAAAARAAVLADPLARAERAEAAAEAQTLLSGAHDAGERAKRVAKLSHADIARKMLSQLDAMFGTPQDPHPASGCCEGFLVKDWAVQPGTYGAYTHPSKGAAGQRPKLCEALHGSIFFAGEACHTGVNPCIHGAMETGEVAALRCLEELNAQGAATSGVPRSRL